MLSNFKAAVAGVAMSAAVLAVAAGSAAQAASSPGWREVQSLHSGIPANGTNYSAAMAPDSRDLWVLGGTGGVSANVVGYPLTEHWDGTSWQRVPGPPRLAGSIYAASASSETDIWALEGYQGCCGTDVLNWNGTRWSDAMHVSTGALSGIAAINASDVWAFGSGNAFNGAGAWHFNGQTWTQVTGNASFVVTASAASATDIWAIGGTVQESGISIEHYDGYAWSYVTSKALNGYYEGIRVTSPTSIWITEIGTANKPYLLHGNGTAWTKTALPGVSLEAPVPDGDGGVWTEVAVKNKLLAVHLSRAGRLSTFAISPDPVTAGLALLPRTSTAIWAGAARTKHGTNAVVWAYGKL